MTNVCVVVNEDVRLCLVFWDAVAGKYTAACDLVIPVFDCVMDLSVL